MLKPTVQLSEGFNGLQLGASPAAPALRLDMTVAASPAPAPTAPQHSFNNAFKP